MYINVTTASVFTVSYLQTVQATVAVSHKEVPKINGEMCGMYSIHWCSLILYISRPFAKKLVHTYSHVCVLCAYEM